MEIQPILGALELADYAVVALIVAVFSRVQSPSGRLESDLRRVERKVDLLLKSYGLQLPQLISPEVQALLKDSGRKIEAIRLHREQNPGLGLAEAKQQVEDYLGSKR